MHEGLLSNKSVPMRLSKVMSPFRFPLDNKIDSSATRSSATKGESSHENNCTSDGKPKCTRSNINDAAPNLL
eukprot:4647488-Amphidinium_carterae.1